MKLDIKILCGNITWAWSTVRHRSRSFSFLWVSLEQSCSREGLSNSQYRVIIVTGVAFETACPIYIRVTPRGVEQATD